MATTHWCPHQCHIEQNPRNIPCNQFNIHILLVRSPKNFYSEFCYIHTSVTLRQNDSKLLSILLPWFGGVIGSQTPIFCPPKPKGGHSYVACQEWNFQIPAHARKIKICTKLLNHMCPWQCKIESPQKNSCQRCSMVETELAIAGSISRVSWTPSTSLSPFQITPVTYETMRSSELIWVTII